MDIDSVDMPLLAAAASTFSSHPGSPSAAAINEFLSQFPLPVLFSSLGTGIEVPGLHSAVLGALERICKSPHSASLLPDVLPYANSGLLATSPSIRRLACLFVGKFLESSDKDGGAAIHAAIDSGILPRLLDALADEDSSVALAAAESLTNLAKSSAGIDFLFTRKDIGGGRLSDMALSSSSLVRIRALSVAATIFGVSEAAAVAIQQSGILSVLEAEINNASDPLAQISAVELLCELAATQNGARLLSSGNFTRHLIPLIKNAAVDGAVRSRAMLVAARLISSSDSSSSAVNLQDAVSIVEAIRQRLNQLKESESPEDRIEQGAAIDALGQIGISSGGAEVLLSSSQPILAPLIESAFMGRGDDVHLASVHALASIVGSERKEASALLSPQSESHLRHLIYDIAVSSGHHKPSVLLLFLLRQTPEVRLATYRLLVALVSRLWCLREVASSKEIIEILIDPRTDTTKDGMDWRHAACVAVCTALARAIDEGESFSTDLLEQLNVAVRRGPYLTKEYKEAIPIVVAEERF